MDLRSTILGLLGWKPASGYDLKRIISDSDVFYWSGNNNQIYKSLLELEQEGLVSHHTQVQEGLPAKKIYATTPAGWAVLQQSLLAAPEPPELRKDFLIQLAWTEGLADEQVLGLLDTYEDEVGVRLRMYQAQAARPASGPERSRREKYLWQRIHENFVAAYQAELDWVRQTRQALSEGNLD